MCVCVCMYVCTQRKSKHKAVSFGIPALMTALQSPHMQGRNQAKKSEHRVFYMRERGQVSESKRRFNV
jgi:hypothetical protein